MDNVTHTLFGLTLARTPLGRAGRGATAALVLASNAPDIDIVSTAGGGPSYLRWHRGPTHGPLGVIGLGLATAAIVWAALRWWDRRRQTAEPSEESPPATFAALASIATIGVALHVLMDFPTSYGSRLLSPFDWHWYAVDWMPIIDVYLVGALAAGLVFGEMSKGSQRRLASIVLMLMAANYGLRAAAHHQAITLAPRLFGPLLPAPCDPAAHGAIVDRWPSRLPTTPPAGSAPGKPCLVEIAATPTFFSPFRWRVIAHLSNAYELHEVDVLDARVQREGAADAFWRRAVRYPNQWTAGTAVAAATPTAQAFLGFSRFPAARTFTDPTGTTTVRWTDVRFVAGVWPGEVQRRADLFSVFIRIGPGGQILDERLGR
jgi:membrane-bound metal-dependent hydrolase YbcI (DUF457 family)